MSTKVETRRASSLAVLALAADLTPVGAERAGNADGSIPAWTGGLPKTPPIEWKTGYADPFADDKPLLGANQVDDAIYPIAVADADGQPLDGNNDYVLHFSKAELPPVDAFWSITMYDAEGYQAANPLNRFAIGDRDALKYNADGSLDIYMQNASPGAGKESNWLPAPRGKLGITLRLYAPRPEVAAGRWVPPAIRKVR